RPELLTEVFGPSTLLLRYARAEQLLAFADALEGQLTATLQAEAEELPAQAELVEALADRAGRLIVNQFPTGVEVGPAMVHGGPWPATSDRRGTSVGTLAIDRFTRCVAYQNFPRELLPPALRGWRRPRGARPGPRRRPGAGSHVAPGAARVSDSGHGHKEARLPRRLGRGLGMQRLRRAPGPGGHKG